MIRISFTETAQDKFAAYQTVVFVFLLYVATLLVFSRPLSAPFQSTILDMQISYEKNMKSRFPNISELKHRNLAEAFLLNRKNFTFTERSSLQSTGLQHLTSLSSGQLGPVITLVSQGFTCLSTLILFRKVSLVQLLKTNSHIQKGITAFLSFAFIVLFGATGALFRSAFLNFGMNIGSGYFWTLSSRLWLLTYRKTLLRITIVGIVSLFLSAPMANFSFLLSALGASTMLMASRFTRWQAGNKNYNIIVNWISTQSLCSVFIAICTSNTNTLERNILANLIAVPYVTWIVTPLSLLVFCLPQVEVVWSFFDMTLEGFQQILRFFSAGTSVHNPFQINLNAQTLALVLVSIWALDDVLQYKRNS